MALGEDEPPTSQPETHGSLHVLQLFDFSYTVLTYDERLILWLRSAEQAHEQISSARVVLGGLGPEVSTPKKKSIERSISDTEYHARILTQDLDPAKSIASSSQDIIRQSRPFLVLRPDNHEVSQDLESLHDACIALHKIIDSCKSVRANSVKRKPISNTIAHVPQVTPRTSQADTVPAGLAATPTLDLRDPSLSPPQDDILNTLPPLDASRLLHHRRTSRLRHRSMSNITQSGEGQAEQQAQNQGANEPDNAFELPDWSNFTPIPLSTARGSGFIPTLSTMPELEAPSEIISVSRGKPDYAPTKIPSIFEPGVHQVGSRDATLQAGNPAQASHSRTTSGSELKEEQADFATVNMRAIDEATVVSSVSDLSSRPREAESAIPAPNITSPQPQPHHLETPRPQYPASSEPEKENLMSSMPPPSTSTPEPILAKASSTRNRLRKPPHVLANKSAKVYLANSTGTADLRTSSEASEHKSQNAPAGQPSSPSSQPSQPTTRQLPPVSLQTDQYHEKRHSQASVSAPPNVAPSSSQPAPIYTPTLTSSPKYQTTKSFTIVSPPVSPGGLEYQSDNGRYETDKFKRLSITSTTSAPPSTSYPLGHQQRVGSRDLSLQHQQTRTWSMPDMSQHKKSLSIGDPRMAPRYQTQPLGGKVDTKDDRVPSLANISTSVTRAPMPPYPMTPVQGPVRMVQQQHEPMPSVPSLVGSVPLLPSQALSHVAPVQQPRSYPMPTPPASTPSSNGAFHFQPPQNTSTANTETVVPSTAAAYRSTHPQQHPPPQTQPQTNILNRTQTMPNPAPPLPQSFQTAQQHIPRHSQSVLYPQQSQQHQQFPQHPSHQPPPAPGQIHGPATIAMVGPPIPPKVTDTTPPDQNLHRERSTSATKSTISSSGSSMGHRQQQPYQQQQQIQLRSTSNSTVSGYADLTGDGSGGGGLASPIGPGAGSSSGGSTLGAGPAVGMARKRSSWLTRQVEKAGLKAF